MFTFFFSSRPFLASFVQKINLACRCDWLVSQQFTWRLEASGFSYSIISFIWQWKNLIINGLSISTLWSKLGFVVKGLSWIWGKVSMSSFFEKLKSKILTFRLSRQILVIIWYYHFVIGLDFMSLSRGVPPAYFAFFVWR